MKELEKLRFLLNQKIEEGISLDTLLPLSEKLDKMVIKFMRVEEQTDKRKEEPIEMLEIKEENIA